MSMMQFHPYPIEEGPQADSSAAPMVLKAHLRPNGGLSTQALRRVCDHVESHLSERLLLSELSTIAKLSECHFSRAFKQSMGISPHRYILNRRLVAASRLILDTDRLLTDISHAVGFFDQSHFTRAFVDAMGETPRAFRWRHR
jgi:AraC-like DNA-binding protein